MQTLIVIPTFNEKENIVDLIEKLLQQDVSVLIVDDQSPDGTGDLVKTLQKKYQRLYLLTRVKKEGLGKAYLAAFLYALQNIPFDYLIEMDADFSHNPLDVQRIIDNLNDFDVVVASRHISGSTLHYPWYRTMLSKLANTYARLMLQLPVYDCTAGFKGYRKKVLEQVIKKPFVSNGYAFQAEILFFVHNLGFTIKEIPIEFKDREKGKSKMSSSNIYDGFWGVLTVRLKNNVYYVRNTKNR